MTTTSEPNEEPTTLWEWLDAFAKGTAPLPRSVFSMLAWSLTFLMLQALGIGLVFTSLCYAAGGWGYLFGWYGWLTTGAAVALLGALAFVCMGRFAASAAYLLFSLVTSVAFMVPHVGLSTITPILVIPPAVVLNGSYFYVAWRFLLRHVDKSFPEDNA